MKKVTRLYPSFKPVNYTIDLVPDRKNMVFNGTVTITGQKTGRPSQRLTLHQKGLIVSSAKVIFHGKSGEKSIAIDRINHHKSFDEVRLHSSEPMYPGNYTIRLEFKGKITTNMDGMYPCNFTHNGKAKQLIATQFESHHAREVFPCIDEPEAKATFDLTLTTPAGETVLSNTPIKSEVTLSGDSALVRTTFETTPQMSTYLLAFVYGELDYLEAKTKQGVTVRTYATPDNVAFTEFALQTAVRCLDYYSEYFGIDYPLAKCDMIALPDFASGAMENWGCITYREQALLVDPENTSLSMKQYVAMVVAHELTHQWFGNLVTMKWWTDLWLNEGFASWFEYLALDHLFPEWHMWTQFIVDDQQAAFKADALEHTHPIEVAINHPDEIRTIFDNISYHKGASVIHMLHGYLGAKDFRTGISYYLKKFSYKNAETADLWDALEEASKKPVASFMKTWTGHSGFPLLQVTVDDTGVSITQDRFVLNPSYTAKGGSWPVPLLTKHTEIPDVLDVKKFHIATKNTKNILCNHGSSGFYRTVYNASHLQNIMHRIQTGHLQPLERLRVLSDISEAAKAGKADTDEVLQLLGAYTNEDDHAVWDVIAGTLGSIRTIMNDDQIRENMKPYVRALVAKQLKRLGWHTKESDSYFDKLLRPTIIGLAAGADEPEVISYALKLFSEIPDPQKKSTTHNNAIDPDLRSIVYTTAARKGGETEFKKMLAMHRATNSNEEKLNLCVSLSSFEQPELIQQSLDLITSEDVRTQDVSYWIAYNFSNRYARNASWNWLKTHWKWLDKNLGTDLAFYRMPIYVARGCSDAEFVAEYKKFFNEVLTPAFDRVYKQGLEMIQWQSAWRERDIKEVQSFFTGQLKKP